MKNVRATIDRILVAEIPHLHPEGITDSAEIVRDLGADSLALQFFVFRLEEEYDISITDELQAGVVTVQDAVYLVERLIAAKEKQ